MKKFLSIFLVLIMVVSLSACASPQNEEPDTPSVEEPSENDEDTDNGSDAEEDKENNKDEPKDDEENDENVEKEAEIKIYLTSEEYVVTGNEDLEKLDFVERKVNYGDTILEEAVVRQLLEEPDSGELINSIPDSVELIEVKVMDDTAYVDFSKDGMEGGSLEEVLTIDQIVTTLLDIGTVEKVQFLLDGEVSDSLMGHVSTTEPFDK